MVCLFFRITGNCFYQRKCYNLALFLKLKDRRGGGVCDLYFIYSHAMNKKSFQTARCYLPYENN